jgi:peptidoglycan/xylan/chitin deacetylase (PgdA/CDA1 family)
MSSTFVLSLDAELAWGSFDKRLTPELVRAAQWENREGIPKLLNMLCRHGISATWAFVGHATLDHCSGHEEMEPVSYASYSGDWFQYDPASDESRHPEWYAHSSFLKVLSAPYPQEIAFHSFSHVDFANPGTPRRRAAQEFEACRKIAREFGIRGDVFIFPRNRVGFLNELREAGFRTFRPPDLTRYRGRHAGLNKMSNVLADLLGVTPLPVVPYLDHELVAIPGSMMLRPMDGWRRLIPAGSRRTRMRKGLERCMLEGRIFHLWLHPIQLYCQQEAMFGLLEECFAQVSLLRERGNLKVATMGETAEEYLGSLKQGINMICASA